MDAIRAERLGWAAVFAAAVAVVVAFAFAPDGIGVPRVAIALGVFAVVGPLAARLSQAGASHGVEPGDQTLRYVAFFVVAAGGQIGLAALGYEGIGPRMAAFAAAWVVGSRAKRLNPRRWRGGQTA
jgi:hypothetical protein